MQTSLAAEFFHPHLRLATDRQQRYLIAMADLGDGPYASAAVNSHLGHKSSGGSSQDRASLIEKELIWSRRRGNVDFTIAGFANYLRSQHPFS